MIDMKVNYADEFVKEFKANKKRYPDTIHKMVKRYEKWKKRSDIHFDLKKANSMLLFTEMFVKHADGELAGQSLVLENWQKFYFSNIYGWQKYSERWKRDVRVIRKSYLQVPKKQGKSLMETAPLLYAIYGEGNKGIQNYVLASDFDQAQNIAEPLGLTIENTSEFYDGTMVYRKEKKVTTIDYSFLINDYKYRNRTRILSKTEKVDGKNTYLIVCDEVHEWSDTERYDGLKSGQASQAEPLLLVCSTAGKNSGAVGVQIYTDSKDILEHDNDDDWFVFITEPNKGYDWEDPAVWEMVNLNLGVSVSIEFLIGEYKDALRNPFRKAEFLSKHLNVFVNYAETYFDKQQLDQCLVKDLGDLTGYQATVGIDLSRTTDLTCVSFNIPTYDGNGNNILKIKQMYFIPQAKIEEKERKRNIPYRDLADKGFVRLCPGRTIDHEMIFDYVIEMSDVYEIQQINYDVAMSEKLVEQFEVSGFMCIDVPQYPAVMNEPFDDFEMLVDQGRVQTDNPLFIFCASNTKIITNINNQKGPSKRKSPEHIDGFVAFLIAHKESLKMMDDLGDEEEYKSMLQKMFKK